jgi:hypothetical protein
VTAMAVVRIEDHKRLDRVLVGTERPRREEIIDATDDLDTVRDAWAIA